MSRVFVFWILVAEQKLQCDIFLKSIPDKAKRWGSSAALNPGQ